jgi:regulator of protease activity HflC (stomatin/prohibitin superfamily)
MDISLSIALWSAFWVVIALVAITAVFSALFTVDQQTVRIVQRLGKFVRVATAGLNVKIPFIDQVSKPVSMRISQLDLQEPTKTKNDVFCEIFASVLYHRDPDKVVDSYYKLADPEAQIKAHVANAIRAQVPTMTLTEVFERKDDIANRVRTELVHVMGQYGYIIDDVLVPNVQPDNKVVAAMNEKNASEQAKVTAENLAEAAYTKTVREAAAQSESMRLHGEGIANQRKAIVNGLQESVTAFQSAVPGSSPTDAMHLVALTQYMDTLKEMAKDGGSKVIFVNHSPGGLADLQTQIRDSMIQGTEAAGPTPEKK